MKSTIACFAIACLAASAADRPAAPAFRLLNASGKPVGNADYRGKVVLLNFWATECGGCRAEIPSFIELQQAYGSRGLVVVGISMDILYENLKNATEGWARVSPFVRDHKLNYPVLMGDDPVTKAYDIQSLPVTYLIDKQGKVAKKWPGVAQKADAEANIKALLFKRADPQGSGSRPDLPR
jgi:peroxiredoxin